MRKGYTRHVFGSKVFRKTLKLEKDVLKEQFRTLHSEGLF